MLYLKVRLSRYQLQEQLAFAGPHVGWRPSRGHLDESLLEEQVEVPPSLRVAEVSSEKDLRARFRAARQLEYVAHYRQLVAFCTRLTQARVLDGAGEQLKHAEAPPVRPGPGLDFT